MGEGEVKTLVNNYVLYNYWMESNAIYYVYFIVDILKKEKYTESVKRVKIPGPEYTYLPITLFS